MSGLMQEVMYQLGIKQYKSTAYHPQSQGALERFHQTLKNMLRAYCLQHGKDWDEGVHLVLFASREVVQESLGFSPFELLYGRTVRGPLKVLKETWLKDDPSVSLLDYVSDLRQRVLNVCEMARKNLRHSQNMVERGPKLRNLDVLKDLQNHKLSHLALKEQDEMMQLVFQFVGLFQDIPTRTDGIFHDVDVGDARPVKQHPYRVNPLKLEIMQQEIAYLLQNDLIEVSKSEWSSPCVLVPESDGTYRFCTDFRKVNRLTKSDSYPIPWVDDCVDNIGVNLIC